MSHPIEELDRDVADFENMVLRHYASIGEPDDILTLDKQLVPHAEIGVELLDCKRVEWFFTSGGALIDARATLESMAMPGWEIWGIVPQPKLGEAHDAFRGVVDRVQGWWHREDGTLTFSSPQIP